MRQQQNVAEPVARFSVADQLYLPIKQLVFLDPSAREYPVVDRIARYDVCEAYLADETTGSGAPGSFCGRLSIRLL